ncbi:MAG: hypothetical protein OXC83_07345 [Chloroflexi bacterium]|nr:hypothetical protein [Chloroflexota bacterium]
MNTATLDNLLHVGVAQSTITPPIGFTISGPEFEDRPALGINDDLSARCVVFESYGQTSALVSLDVWGISDSVRERLIAAISQATNIPQTNIIITATANGNSPPLWRENTDQPPEYANYVNYLPDIVAGAALEASLALEPAAVGTVSAILPNLSCFANPNQPEQLETERETLQLSIVLTSDNHIKCLIYNFACPATIIGNTQEWTADYPGIASSALEQAGVDTAIFLQGASADIRPFDWWDGNTNVSHAERTWSDAQAFGILLATQAIRAAPNAIARRNAPIKTAQSEDGTLTALTLGEATLITTNQPQPIEFVADLRSALPNTKLLVNANSSGRDSPTSAAERATTLSTAIELVNRLAV